jgi:hypothetical protein
VGFTGENKPSFPIEQILLSLTPTEEFLTRDVANTERFLFIITS